jgi:hypothetical protein
VGVPTVISVSPNSGDIAGGTVSTIKGNQFTGATQVNYGGTPAASFNVVDDQTITATSPAGSVGAVDITVVAPLGTTPTGSSDLFTYTTVVVTTTPPGKSGGRWSYDRPYLWEWAQALREAAAARNAPEARTIVKAMEERFAPIDDKHARYVADLANEIAKAQAIEVRLNKKIAESIVLRTKIIGDELDDEDAETLLLS